MNQLSNTKNGEHTLVLGIGNPLCGDDGAGIRAVEMLIQSPLPPGVRVMEAGLPGWELPTWLEGWPCVILVDAVEMGLPPGSWQLFRLRELNQQGELELEQARFLIENQTISLHQPDLASGLALAEALNLLPDRLYLYGIQPASVLAGGYISSAVRANLPEMVEQIISDLGKGIYEPETNIAC